MHLQRQLYMLHTDLGKANTKQYIQHYQTSV